MYVHVHVHVHHVSTCTRAPVGSAWLDLVNTAKKLSRDVMTLLLRLSVLAQCSKHAMQTPLWLLEPPKYPLPLRRRSLKEKWGNLGPDLGRHRRSRPSSGKTCMVWHEGFFVSLQNFCGIQSHRTRGEPHSPRSPRGRQGSHRCDWRSRTFEATCREPDLSEDIFFFGSGPNSCGIKLLRDGFAQLQALREASSSPCSAGCVSGEIFRFSCRPAGYFNGIIPETDKYCCACAL